MYTRLIGTDKKGVEPDVEDSYKYQMMPFLMIFRNYSGVRDFGSFREIPHHSALY
jgi:hypothetical protein